MKLQERGVFANPVMGISGGSEGSLAGDDANVLHGDAHAGGTPGVRPGWRSLRGGGPRWASSELANRIRFAALGAGEFFEFALRRRDLFGSPWLADGNLSLITPGGRRLVVLVLDFSDDLFENVFESADPEHRAITAANDREVPTPSAKPPKRIDDGQIRIELRRRPDRIAHHHHALPRVEVKKILGVEDPYDVIQASLIDGKPRKAGFSQQVE